MAEIKPAVDFVLDAEGGDRFTNDRADSGGATRYGISLRFLREIPDDRLRRYGIFATPQVADVQELTEQQARLIYAWEFWMQAPYDQMESQGIANYVFSMAVLHGHTQATKILQRATWAVMGHSGYMADDGLLGQHTLSAVNAMMTNPALRDSLVAALMAEHAGFCRLLAEIRPKDGKYLNGWLQRCYVI